MTVGVNSEALVGLMKKVETSRKLADSLHEQLGELCACLQSNELLPDYLDTIEQQRDSMAVFVKVCAELSKQTRNILTGEGSECQYNPLTGEMEPIGGAWITPGALDDLLNEES